MQDIVWIVVWVVLIGAVFGWMWRAGHLARLTVYVQQTKEELRKCSWPSWDELKGSTLIVMVSIVLLGGFTVLVDFVFSMVVGWIT